MQFVLDHNSYLSPKDEQELQQLLHASMFCWIPELKKFCFRGPNGGCWFAAVMFSAWMLGFDVPDGCKTVPRGTGPNVKPCLQAFPNLYLLTPSKHSKVHHLLCAFDPEQLLTRWRITANRYAESPLPPIKHALAKAEMPDLLDQIS